MRIAYLTSRLPYPPIDGGRARSYHFLRHLLHCHQVTMYAIKSSLSNHATTHLPRLSQLNENLFQISQSGYIRNALGGFLSKLPLQARLFNSRELAQALTHDVERGDVDVMIVHLVRMAEYARPFNKIPRILDMTDSIHLHYARMPRRPLSPHWHAARLERKRLSHYESDVSSWFDGVLLASPLDIAWVRQRCPDSNLLLVPTGIETSNYTFNEGAFDPNRIIFVGKLDYLPNSDAVLYFAREILPKVRRTVPKAEFVVVGWNPPRAIMELAKKRYIKILANVPDIRPEVAKSAVSVAPMRFGAGIQVKILESLALGTPAVATDSVIGAFGDEGKEAILVGRNSSEFAEQVSSILRDRSRRERLRRAGRRLIETRFQWKQTLSPLDKVLDAIAERQLQTNPELFSRVRTN